MLKILLAIIASAVAVTMLSAFGPLAALANPSTVKGNPGSPTNSCTSTDMPGQGQVNGGVNAGGAHNPGSQASSVYPNTQTGNAGNTAPHAGAQYDASCNQQAIH